MTEDRFWTVVFGLCIAVLIVALYFGDCYRPDDATAIRALRGHGFNYIELGRQDVWSCGRNLLGVSFTATNPSGERVQGTVCCGILMACTVRF